MRSKQKLSPIGLFFWGWWVLAGAVGVAVVVAINEILGRITPTVLGWMLVGTAVGVAQQLVWRKYGPVRHWGWASLVGWSLGALVGRLAVGWEAGAWDVDWAVVGVIVGAAQYLVLQPQMRQAGWWILASATGLVLAGSLGGAVALLEDWFMFKGLLDLNERVTESLGFVLAGLLGGAVYGLITGAWLVWLWRCSLRTTNQKC
jgi:hypothetical protein